MKWMGAAGQKRVGRVATYYNLNCVKFWSGGIGVALSMCTADIGLLISYQGHTYVEHSENATRH